MSKDMIREFINLAKAGNINSYHTDARKVQFHRQGKYILKMLATAMGLEPGTFDIRSNLGGIAVSGEITLHGESIYVQFSESSIQDKFMFRSCNGRKDYEGNPNQWAKWEELEDLQTFATKCARVVALGNVRR